MYQKRSYRNLTARENLVSFRVAVKETDLFVQAAKPLEEITRELILKHRGVIEAYIKRHPEFVKTLKPWRVCGPAPNIINHMVSAGENAGVGPMAAVAGAIAEHVGIDLLIHTDEVVVENGGDIFFKTNGPVTIGIFAGKSPISLGMGLRVDPGEKPLSVCTSSGTVGHSLSLGKADAVCVVSGSCSLADAAATSIGNQITSKAHIGSAIDFGKNIKGVDGIVVIMGNKIGMWGELEVVRLK
ncbi:MAG: UPF0280 family protein [Desulfobacterales bacterium]|jgi:hypothetical protein